MQGLMMVRHSLCVGVVLGIGLGAGCENTVLPPITPPVPHEPPAVVSEVPPTLVQVKFVDGLEIALRDGRPVDRDGVAFQSEATRAALDRLADGIWVRTHTVAEQALDELRINGERNIGRPLPDLNNYYYLALPGGIGLEDATALLRPLREVQNVFRLPIQATALPPDYTDYRGTEFTQIIGEPVPVLIEEELPYQQYLDAAPTGVDARLVWQLFGGTGANVKLGLVEHSFNWFHEDLPPIVAYNGLPENVPETSVQHGTQSWGVMAGLANGFGVTGIAHDATPIFASSYTSPGIHGAIEALLEDEHVLIDVELMELIDGPSIDPGDVIVVDLQVTGPRFGESDTNAQFGYVPVEWYQPYFDAILTTTANGVTVVIAAGNGEQDLDDPIYCFDENDPNCGNDPWHPHNPFRTDGGRGRLRMNDSGAIIVGAGFSGADWSIYASPGLAPRQKLWFSNYGWRVDLQAWGDGVVTSGHRDAGEPLYVAEGDNLAYTSQYGGTSSATPMVGSSAAAFQSIWIAAEGNWVTPRELRDALVVTGTPPDGNQTENIGPRPDLKAAVQRFVNVWDVLPPPPPPSVSRSNDPLLRLEVGGPLADVYRNRTWGSAPGPPAAVVFTVNGSDPDPNAITGEGDPNTFVVIVGEEVNTATLFEGPPEDLLLPMTLKARWAFFLTIQGETRIVAGEIVETVIDPPGGGGS